MIELFNSWSGAGQFFAVMAAVQIILRGIAEGLAKVEDLTESKWDNKVAAYCDMAANIISKFGYGSLKK
jgi:hypothetical protein